MGAFTKRHDVADEFATVDAVLQSSAATRRTDAFVLSWVKVEKQFRRLFSYLVYQNPAFSKDNESALIDVFVASRRLNWNSFINCIDAHGPVTIAQLIGPTYPDDVRALRRIRDYRNKILHGQITGQRLQSRELEKDIKFLRDWIHRLGTAAEKELGYDGIGRNTFHKAKASSPIAAMNYPFASVEEFAKWLNRYAV